MARTFEKTLYLALQTGGWDADPSSDGSGYAPIPAEEISELPAGIEQVETAYQDGRSYPKANEVGAPTLAEVTFKVPWIGLGTAAGDGASPPAVDWLDNLLTHVLQTAATLDGEGVGIGSTGTDLVLDTDAFDVGDVIAYCPGSGSQSQLAHITVDDTDGTYTVSPSMSPAAVDAGVVYGSRHFTPPASSFVGGNYLAGVLVDSSVGTYTGLNGRITALSAEGAIGQRSMLSVTIAFDTLTEDASAKTALPAAIQAPAVTPVKVLGSPLAYDGTFYDCASFTLDFGITAAPVKATGSLTGRAGHEMVTLAPQLTFTPLRTNAIRNLQRTADTGVALLQIGAGVLSGTVLNTVGIFMGKAQVTAAEGEDDEGHARQSVTLMAKDPGASGVFFRVSRF